MCGILGVVGIADVAPSIVDALKRLECRGFDSAGIAAPCQGALVRSRAEGKLTNLKYKLLTRGVPNADNAHPHFLAGVAMPITASSRTLSSYATN